MAYYVLIADQVHESALEVFKSTPEITVSAQGKMTREQVLAQVAGADALIVRSGVQVDAEVLAAGSKLKVVARAGVGVDNVDVAEATRRGIAVMNTPDGNTIAAAEHTFGLMLALARHIPAAHASLAGGAWDRKSFMGVELRGKTLGVIGFGRIGQEVAKRALAFQMTVIAHEPWEENARKARAMGIDTLDLDEVFARADFITLHAALNDTSRGMVNAASLSKMKRGVRIVNVARGALIDADALAEAIKSGQVAGAALDVYDPEPPPPGHLLIGLAGVVHTPHLGASTEEAQVAVAVEAARQVVAALTRGEWRNVVNPEVVKAEK